MVKTSPALTFGMEKLPSISVMEPLVVPLIATEAPMTASPLASFTTPVQFPACCTTFVPSTFSSAGVALAVPTESVPRNNTMAIDL